MPEPRPGESKDDFVQRCMGDSKSVADFPEAGQRFAFCNSQFERRQDLTSGDLAEDGGQLNPEQGSRRCPPGQIFDPERQACVDRSSRGAHEKPRRPRRRADEEVPTPLGNRGSPGHVDPFLDDELRLAGVLATRTKTLADGSIIPIYESVFAGAAGGQSPFSQAAFDDATEAAARVWGARAFDGPTLDRTVESVRSVMDKGEAQIVAGILEGAPSRQVVFDGMVRATQYRTNQFFNTQVVPALQAEVDKLFDATGAMGQPDVSGIRRVLDKRLKSVPYWRVVANAATSRGYHYGLIKASQFQGRRTYRLVAVIDKLTSKICEDLDGREFHIADATSVMEQVAGSDNEDEVKNLMPWPKLGDIQGQDSEALRAQGVLVPPFHGNCRTTLQTF